MDVGQLDIRTAVLSRQHLDPVGIAGQVVLLDGVGNLRSVFTLRQIRKGPGPVPVFICLIRGQRQRDAIRRRIVLCQGQVDFTRTDSVVIGLVIPDQHDSERPVPVQQFGCIAVDHIVPVIGSFVFRQILALLFGNGIGVFLPAVMISRQVFETEVPVPVVIFMIFVQGFCNGIAILIQHRFLIGQQIDLNRHRAFSVLIICVIPDLAAGYGDRFDLMGVGNGESFRHVPADGGIIFFDRILHDGVLDFGPAVPVFREIFEAEVPVSVLIRFHGLLSAEERDDGVEPSPEAFHGFQRGCFDLLPVRQQRDRNAARPQAVPVIIVVPYFRSGNFDRLGGMGIGDRKAVLRAA